MHPTSGNTSMGWVSEERRAEMEQSLKHLLHSEMSRDESFRELSVDHPKRQLKVFDKLSLVLSACRNRLVPINHLPQDIMHRIFSIVLQLDNVHGLQLSVGSDYPVKFVDQRGRLRLVSRLWNSFVVSTPGFWSLVDIRVPSQEVLSLKIKLAQQAELCITYRSLYFAHIDDQLLASVLSAHLDRIRTLRLGSITLTDALLQNSFPGLCTLELWSHGRWHALAQDRFPQLCNLRLSDCRLPQSTTPLNTLRILHLYDNWYTDLNEIIGFLRICPEIEELTISQPEDRPLPISSSAVMVRLEKLRRLELRNLEMACLLRIFGFAKIPNFKQVVFTVPVETTPFIESGLQEILDTLQVSSSRSSSMELSVFRDAVTCTTQDGRLVKVCIPQRLSSVSLAEQCADIFLDRLKPRTLRIAVELEDRNRLRRLKQVLQQNNVTELRVRLGCDALQLGRAVTEYLAQFSDESEEETEEQSGSDSPLPLPSLTALSFENGTVDIPHLLRMVASRFNDRRLASTRIQKITLVKCENSQWPDLSSSFRRLGVNLIVQ